jgi:hypothetical protein
VSRHKHNKPAEAVPNAAEPLPPEPREQTNGFEFPVGVASGQATPVKFYCYATQCPGYAYSASDQAHPVETCGTLMNSLDNPLHSKPEGKVSEIMKENAQVSAAIAATETTGFATDRLSGIFSDGSSDSKPEGEQSSELHTDVEASDHPITTQTAEQAEQERASIANSSRVYDAIELRGSLGMFLERPNDLGWIELLAAESGGFIQLCEYHQINGVDSWTITRRDYDGWLQVIPFSGFRRIVTRTEIPDWVKSLREDRMAAFAEGIIGTSSEEPEASTDMPQLEPAPVDPKDTQVLSIALHCVDIANELNVDVLQVMRLVDGLVQTFAQFVSFKELVASTPLVPALFDHFLSPDARAKLMTLVKGMADGPIRSTINGVAQAAVDDFESKVTTLNEQLEAMATEIARKLHEPEKADSSDDSVVDAIAKIETALVAMREDQARALGSIEHQVDLLGEKVDTINNDLGLLEERMNQVQPDWQPPKGKKAPKSKPSPLPHGKKADFFQTSREELERLRREGKVPTVSEFDDDEDDVVDVEEDEDDDFELDDDDDEVIEAVAPPSRRPPLPKAARKRAMRAKAKARREAKAKASSRPPPAKAPLKGPKRGGLFAQARRKPGRPPKKPPVENRPMGDTPKSAKWGTIEKFMGKKHLPKVRTLLGRMETDKLAKFLAGAKKGFFHMDLTGWTVQEQGAFIKWFYAKH